MSEHREKERSALNLEEMNRFLGAVEQVIPDLEKNLEYSSWIERNQEALLAGSNQQVVCNPHDCEGHTEGSEGCAKHSSCEVEDCDLHVCRDHDCGDGHSCGPGHSCDGMNETKSSTAPRSIFASEAWQAIDRLANSDHPDPRPGSA